MAGTQLVCQLTLKHLPGIIDIPPAACVVTAITTAPASALSHSTSAKLAGTGQ